jgi:hypothetical protein
VTPLPAVTVQFNGMRSLTKERDEHLSVCSAAHSCDGLTPRAQGPVIGGESISVVRYAVARRHYLAC